MGSPFRVLDRFAEEMDRLFDDFGFGRGGHAAPGTGRAAAVDPPRRGVAPERRDAAAQQRTRDPRRFTRVEQRRRQGRCHGGRHHDSAERKREHEEEKAGVYRSERSYGSFYRRIALPEGAMAEQAKAIVKDGVLEVTMPAPPESVKLGRRLEITEATTQKK